MLRMTDDVRRGRRSCLERGCRINQCEINQCEINRCEDQVRTLELPNKAESSFIRSAYKDFVDIGRGKQSG